MIFTIIPTYKKTKRREKVGYKESNFRAFMMRGVLPTPKERGSKKYKAKPRIMKRQSQAKMQIKNKNLEFKSNSSKQIIKKTDDPIEKCAQI